MEREDEVTSDQPKTRWLIDLDWYPRNNRAFSTLTKDVVCPGCTGKLSKKGKDNSAKDLLSAIKSCCSQSPDFITDQLPIMESIFRLFLANGNQPLDLEELGEQLSERRSGDTYRTSPEIISRLLKNDRYYGLQEAKD